MRFRPESHVSVVISHLWIDGKKTHVHDKTSEAIEAWLEEGKVYKDRNGKIFKNIGEDKKGNPIFKDEEDNLHIHIIN